MKEIARSRQAARPGSYSTHPADIAPEKISGMERGTEWLLRRAGTIGEHADRWAQEVIRTRGIEGMRAVMGLLSLVDRERARGSTRRVRSPSATGRIACAMSAN